MEQLKHMRNPYNVTLSFSNIEQKIEKIVRKDEERKEVKRLKYMDPEGHE